MIKRFASSVVLTTILCISSTPLALAAKLTASTTSGHNSSTTTQAILGDDVSYPQCSKKLPSGQAFGIVGINGGLANDANPCLAPEFTWALNSSGATNQPKAGLYVNTANPGNLSVADWPTSGSTPYGTCSGGDDQACAYQYGQERAQGDVGFLAAAVPTANPQAYTWWLDVEIGNSWETNTANNRADLEGMTAYFESIGAKVGLYSTAAQWSQIVGTVTGGNLEGLLNWRPSGATLSTAKQACTAQPLTPGGTVSITQYTAKSTDYDYSCI